jgi:hypothetical protein
MLMASLWRWLNLGSCLDVRWHSKNSIKPGQETRLSMVLVGVCSSTVLLKTKGRKSMSDISSDFLADFLAVLDTYKARCETKHDSEVAFIFSFI